MDDGSLGSLVQQWKFEDEVLDARIRSDLTGFINDTYALKALTRYNNKFKVIKESVAEHMYFVSLIVLRLAKHYDFNVERALSMAIIHDLPEIYVSDVTRDVKLKYPKLNKILSDIEKDSMQQFGPEWKEIFEEFERQDTTESQIVLLADALSVKQYTQAEVSMGNESYMKGIYDTIDERINDLLVLLKYARNEIPCERAWDEEDKKEALDG